VVRGGVLSRFRLGKPFQVFCRLGDASPLDRCERIEVLQKLRLCVFIPPLYVVENRAGGGLIPATASSSSSRINALRCILPPVCAIDARKRWYYIPASLPLESWI
jgi:hypothetical protein